MVRFLFAIPLIMHGLAHVSGFFASWTSKDLGFAAKPWLFSRGIYLNSPLGRLFGIVWLLASVALVASAIGIILRHDWWFMLATAGCILSSLAIFPWWNTVPPGARAGAVFNLIILVLLLSPLKVKILEILVNG